MRKLLFWLHLFTGFACAAVVLVMSATGVLLTYQRQITAWADMRGASVPTNGTSSTVLPTAKLLERAGRQMGKVPTSVIWRSRANAPVEVVFGRDGRAFVDPYTGAVLGTGSTRTRTFFQKVTAWHRWLGAQADPGRKRGKMITGAANIGFLFLVTSGLFLWWPRNWSARALRNVLLFRRGLSPKARAFNQHNVTGFWLLVPLFLIVLSGVVISYRWAGDLVYRAVGETPPSREAAAPPSREAAAPQRANVSGRPDQAVITSRTQSSGLPVDVDAVIATIRARTPDWRTITLTVPKADARTVSFAIDRGTGGEPQKRAQLKVSDAGEEWTRFSDGTRGRRARSILRFMHTGEVGGIAGQTIAGIACLGAMLLVWTGVSLSLRRFGAWQIRRAPKRPPAINLSTPLPVPQASHDVPAPRTQSSRRGRARARRRHTRTGP